MWISKKKVLSLLKENLEEMAMDFDTQDRPHGDIQRDLERGETPYKNVPFPETGRDDQNFQELLASERYKQVVANVRQYVGDIPTLSGDNQLMPLASMMQGALNNIINTERAHRQELEELAVRLVQKELSIPEGALQLNAKIVGVGDVNNEDFDYKSDEEAEREAQQQDQNPPAPQDGGQEEPPEEEQFTEPEQQNIEVEEDLYAHLSNLNLERAKRRFINGLVQGASKRGHYMYHYVSDEIKRITDSEDIINQYGIMMSINDTLYWQMGNDMMKQAASMGTPPEGGQQAPQGGGQPPQGGGEEEQPERQGEREGAGTAMAGRVDVDRNAEVPTVNAVGVNFPVLVHELIKGVYEIYSLQGVSKDAEVASAVASTEDTLFKENWDLRIGPAIWDRVMRSFPESIRSDENQFEMQNYLYVELIKLEPKQFFTFMREIMLKSERSLVLMDDLLEAIYKMWEDDTEGAQAETAEFHQELEQASNEISDEDMNSFLQSLGINMSVGGDFDVNNPDANRTN